MLKNTVVTLGFLLGLISVVHAQMSFAKLDLKLSSDKAEVNEGDVITLTLTGNVPKDYAVYSSNIKCKIGPLPPTMEIVDTNFLQPFGGFVSVGDKIERDEIFDCEVGKFTKKVLLTHRVKVLKVSHESDIIFEFQMCNEKSGICLPVRKNYTLALKKVINETSKQINTKHKVSRTGAKIDRPKSLLELTMNSFFNFITYLTLV